jgi:hypothetical protein
MRAPHFHVSDFAWPRLNRSSVVRAPKKVVHLRAPRVLRRADILALILAATLAAAVVVALLIWT